MTPHVGLLRSGYRSPLGSTVCAVQQSTIKFSKAPSSYHPGTESQSEPNIVASVFHFGESSGWESHLSIPITPVVLSNIVLIPGLV